MTGLGVLHGEESSELRDFGTALHTTWLHWWCFCLELRHGKMFYGYPLRMHGLKWRLGVGRRCSNGILRADPAY